MIVEDPVFWNNGDNVAMEFHTTTSTKRRQIELPREDLPKLMESLSSYLDKTTAKEYKTNGFFVCEMEVAVFTVIVISIVSIILGAILI